MEHPFWTTPMQRLIREGDIDAFEANLNKLDKFDEVKAFDDAERMEWYGDPRFFELIMKKSPKAAQRWKELFEFEPGRLQTAIEEDDFLEFERLLRKGLVPDWDVVEAARNVSAKKRDVRFIKAIEVGWSDLLSKYDNKMSNKARAEERSRTRDYLNDALHNDHALDVHKIHGNLKKDWVLLL